MVHVVLARRAYGEPGLLRTGPFHLVSRSHYDNLVGYPEYQAGAVVKAWCGARFRMGPSEVLHDRPDGGQLNARLCARCFTLEAKE